MDQTIKYMPLLASDSLTVVAGDAHIFKLRCWIPGENVQRAMVVLDDELIGDAIIGTVQAMLVGGEIEPIAIYSVGFGADQFGDLYGKRAEYLTMEAADLGALGIEKTGGGPELLSYLTERVLPAIESELPHLKRRPALAGYSLGGLFVLQAATQFPHLFGDLSVFSPSLFLGNEVQADLDTLFSQEQSRRLFLAAGKLEQDRAQTGLKQHMYELVAELGERLEAVHGNRIATRIVESETHYSLPFSTMPAMLRHLCGSPEALG